MYAACSQEASLQFCMADGMYTAYALAGQPPALLSRKVYYSCVSDNSLLYVIALICFDSQHTMCLCSTLAILATAVACFVQGHKACKTKHAMYGMAQDVCIQYVCGRLSLTDAEKGCSLLVHAETCQRVPGESHAE